MSERKASLIAGIVLVLGLPSIAWLSSRIAGTPANAAAASPKPPSALVLASPDGQTTITILAANAGASIRMIHKTGDKEIKAVLNVDDRTGQLWLADDRGDIPVAADDLRRAYQALGR